MASRSNSNRARVVRLEEYASSGAELDAIEQRASKGTAATRTKAHAPSSAGRSDASRGRNAASASHRQNDRYMEEFDAAYDELHAAAAVSRSGDRGGSSNAGAGKRAVPRQVAPVADGSESTYHSSSGSKECPSVDTEMVAAHAHALPPAMGDLGGAWLKGPVSPEGTLHAVSAQPLMCMSMSADEREVVVGSSDHALYVIPLQAATASSSARLRSTATATAASKPRTLYSKKYGHSEWVTCVTHLADNRVVSGGMDSKLCLWDATGVKCEDLVGHSSSVSLVLALGDDLLASAGYDKTLRVWHVGKHTASRARERSAIKASAAPILDASPLLSGHSLVCGDRDGSVHVVDLHAAQVVQKLSGVHRGHTTSVLGGGTDPHGFYSGGQDGVVKVWDVRQKSALQALALHVDARSGKSGAVGFLRESRDDANVLVTGGADGTIKVLDKRASFAVLHDFTEHMDFIYSLQLHGQLCLSGAGNGMLHVHDWKRGTLLYGLGANQAAVRAIAATRTQLVASGDDGGVVVYDMQ